MSDQTVLEDAVSPWDGTDRPGVAAAVLRSGVLTAVACRGMASIEHAVPFASSTPISIASISKQFVCASILLLEQRGALAIDDSITAHLQALPGVAPGVTIRHAMTNTSGLRDFEYLLMLAGVDMEAPFEHERVMQLIGRQRGVVAPAGTEYLYCNTGFRLLGEIVKRVSGRPWREFLQNEILVPLAMDASYVCTEVRTIVPGLATAYAEDRAGGYRRDAGLLPVYAVSEGGESAVCSNLDDMIRWAAASVRTDEIGEAVRRLPTAPRLLDGRMGRYGFGTFVEEWRGRRLWRHGGGMPGIRTEIVHLPDDDLSLVCVSNDDGSLVIDVMRSVAEVLLHAEPSAPGRSWPSGRFVDEDHGAVVDLWTGPEGPGAAVWDWTLLLESTGHGLARSYSTWLELEWPPDDATEAIPVARLGGTQLRLRRAAAQVIPATNHDLVGRYRSDELDATYIIASQPDGHLTLHVEGPSGHRPMGDLWAITPDMVAVGTSGGHAFLSIRRVAAGIEVSSAGVRGIPFGRVTGEP